MLESARDGAAAGSKARRPAFGLMAGLKMFKAGLLAARAASGKDAAKEAKGLNAANWAAGLKKGFTGVPKKPEFNRNHLPGEAGEPSELP